MIWALVLIAIVVGTAVLLSSELAPPPNIDNYVLDTTNFSVEKVSVRAKGHGNILWETLGYEVNITLKYGFGGAPTGEVLTGSYKDGVFYVKQYDYYTRTTDISVFVTGQNIPFYVLVLDYKSGRYVCFKIDRLGVIDGSELEFYEVDDIRKEVGLINKLLEPIAKHWHSIGEALALFIAMGVNLLPYIGVIIILWLIYPLAEGEVMVVFDRLRMIVEFLINIFIRFLYLIKP